MHAIILSYDKQHPYCELVYRLYMELWPGCPFIFRIPWNNTKPEYLVNKANVELLQCDVDIGKTMMSLLQGLDDTDWVYWCIDDRFPVSIQASKMLNIHKSINTLSEYDYIRPYFHPRITPGEYVWDNYMIQTKQHEWGYYMHHWCKVNMLRRLYTQNNCVTIDDYHRFLCAGIYDDKKGLRIGSANETIIRFGEPCIDGVRTKLGQQYLNKYNIIG